jgi:hypothetical protein
MATLLWRLPIPVEKFASPDGVEKILDFEEFEATP